MKTCISLINEMLNNNNGIISASDVTNAGIPRFYLTKMCDAGMLVKIDRGLYSIHHEVNDELYSLQYRYNRGIYSHETALYLHKLIGDEPKKYTMVVPYGYNTKSMKCHDKLLVKHTPLIKYEIGLTEVKTPFGNIVQAYDIERTICDMVLTKEGYEMVNQIILKYLQSEEYNFTRLAIHSIDLGMSGEVHRRVISYMQMMM